MRTISPHTENASSPAPRSHYVSNAIDFFPDIQNLVKKYVIGREYEGVFLKPKFGDASGVRGAARLGRKTTY